MASVVATAAGQQRRPLPICGCCLPLWDNSEVTFQTAAQHVVATGGIHYERAAIGEEVKEESTRS